MKGEFKEYPGVGLLSHTCDHCAKPITFLTYRGRDGEYCSNVCYEAAERKESKTMATELKAKKSTAPAAEPVKVKKIKTAVVEEPVKIKKIKKADPEEAPPVKKMKKVEPPVAVPTKKAKVAAPAPAPTKPTKKVKKAPKADAPAAFRAGTANAAVYELLSDEEVHTLQECFDASEAAGAKWPKDALWFVMKGGEKTGAYEVVKDKAAGTVQLTFAQ